jgi:hypothetical protein
MKRALANSQQSLEKKEEATSSFSSSFKIQNLKFNILLFPHSRSFASILGSTSSSSLASSVLKSYVSFRRKAAFAVNTSSK